MTSKRTWIWNFFPPPGCMPGCLTSVKLRHAPAATAHARNVIPARSSMHRSPNAEGKQPFYKSAADTAQRLNHASKLWFACLKHPEKLYATAN